MLALDVPVLNRPGEDMEHFWLVRRLGKLWYLEPGGQYAHAFELPGYVQGERRLAADGYGPSVSEEGSDESAPTPLSDLVCMSMAERREYLRALPLEGRRELLQALQERLQELEGE